MDVFIANENIKHFNALLLTEKDEVQRRVLLGLLRLEEGKLAAALAKKPAGAVHQPSDGQA